LNIEDLLWFIKLIWKILPAYIANASPVIFIKNGHPIDFNRKFIDNKPLFGRGKTIEGFIIGILSGTIVGILQNRILAALMLSIGAMCGDLIGSFIKRRLDIGRGGPAPILDQTSFLFGAIILSSLIEKFTLFEIIILVVITIPLHFITNVIAFLLKIKKVPW